MKRKHTTQRNHLIFKLKSYEQSFVSWRSKRWKQTKICFDAVSGIAPFYFQKCKDFVKWFNENATELKNPMVREQIETIKKERESVSNALKSIHRHIVLKRLKLSRTDKKCLYVPNAHKDISFNQNLVSKFGTGE